MVKKIVNWIKNITKKWQLKINPTGKIKDVSKINPGIKITGKF